MMLPWMHLYCLECNDWNLILPACLCAWFSRATLWRWWETQSMEWRDALMTPNTPTLLCLLVRCSLQAPCTSSVFLTALTDRDEKLRNNLVPLWNLMHDTSICCIGSASISFYLQFFCLPHFTDNVIISSVKTNCREPLWCSHHVFFIAVIF